MKRRETLFIKDILKNILLIEDSIKNLSKTEFIKNKLIIDATVRRLEVIGEAVKNISEEIKTKYPEIEWKKIAGTRDTIIHAYFSVDLDIIWEIIKWDIPILKNKILKIERELE
jgi:uncharacterized protein with HEPN domain